MNNEKQHPAVQMTSQHFRKEAQAREGLAAWKDYNAQAEATRQKTERLREQRLRRDASTARAPSTAAPKAKAASRRASK